MNAMLAPSSRDTFNIEDEPRPQREISGKTVVIAVLLYSGVIVGLLWAFAVIDRAPFQKVEHALAAEFPDSLPKVRGGREKGDESKPMLLRIVMRVPFNPEGDEQQAEKIADRVFEIARANHDTAPYDEVEIDLFQARPEQEILQRTIHRKLR